MRATIKWTPAVGVFLVYASILHAQELTYTFYDLGDLGTDLYSLAADVNDAGVVVGASVPREYIHAFMWHNGVMTDIALDFPMEKGNFGEAYSVSQTGIVAGGAVGPGGLDPPGMAVVWDRGVVTVLPVPPDCEHNWVLSRINGAGTLAVGRCMPDNGQDPLSRATVHSLVDETVQTLGPLPGFPDDASSSVQGVNDHGVAVGSFFASGLGARAFIWSDGEMTELVNTVGGEEIVASDINNQGTIVGWASTADAYAQGMMYKDGVMTIIGPTTARDVNERDQSVAVSIVGSASHPILYDDGKVIDLFEFLPDYIPSSGAGGLNNYGWIVGSGDDYEDNYYMWLLVPIYDKGDYDGDGDVDHQDFQHFQRCFAAEPYIDGTLHVGCSVFDFDDDVDLDLDDYAAFQSAFTGPTAPNHNPNGPG